MAVRDELAVPEVVRQIQAKYAANVAHAAQVARLVQRLFQDLAPLHRLEVVDGHLLVLGAWLHDLGHYIAARKHHEHSAQIIRYDRLLDGWSPELREEVALLALYHRKKKIRTDDFEPGQVTRLSSMVALLRLADVLDRAHDQQTVIRAVEFDLAALELQIRLQGMELSPIVENLQAKCNLAVKTWGVRLTLISERERIVVPRQDT